MGLGHVEVYPIDCSVVFYVAVLTASVIPVCFPDCVTGFSVYTPGTDVVIREYALVDVEWFRNVSENGVLFVIFFGEFDNHCILRDGFCWNSEIEFFVESCVKQEL